MKPTYLSIPEPCHQPWGEMTPNEQGRFCSSCEKTVVDLKGKSDREIVHFFDNNKETICARIPKSKLDIPLYAFEPENNFINLKAIVLGTAILTSFVGFSEEDFNVLPDNYLVELMQNEDTISKVEDTVEFTFFVNDSLTGEPLVFATIKFLDEEQKIIGGCKTDFEGVGKVKIKQELLEQTYTIKIDLASEGYKETLLSKNELLKYNEIVLTQSEPVLIGELVVTTATIRKSNRIKMNRIHRRMLKKQKKKQKKN